MKFDVAILGAGAAGMFVALAAQARGLQVALIDPHTHKANNFAISGLPYFSGVFQLAMYYLVTLASGKYQVFHA